MMISSQPISRNFDKTAAKSCAKSAQQKLSYMGKWVQK
jgi:hypothetical protein